MTIDKRLLAGTLVLSLALGACGGSAPAASSGAGEATDAPAASEAPAATDAPETEAPETEAPAETEEPAGTDDGGGTGGGPLTDLAALLPESVGDVTYERVGFDGDQLGIYGAMAGLNSDELDPLLQKYGKTVNDVDFAIASSTSSQTAGMVWAMRLEGVPADELMSGMNLESSDMEKVSIAGKQVWTAGGGGFGVWAYPKDDILFVILLASNDIAEGLIEQLP